METLHLSDRVGWDVNCPKHQSNVITRGPDPGLKVGFVIFAVVTMTGTVTGGDVRPAGVPGSREQRFVEQAAIFQQQTDPFPNLPEILKKQLQLPVWDYRESSTDIQVRNRWERLALVNANKSH